MSKFPAFLRKFFFRNRSVGSASHSVDDLRAAFAHRYHNFKLLLTANNKALEIMTDLEKALQGIRPFGMSFVRSNCTGVSVNVFRMIKHLDELAPGKYRELYDSFKHIRDHINLTLAYKKVFQTERLVLPLSEVTRDSLDEAGAKMANVGTIRNEIGLPTPDGFVVTAGGYERFVSHNDLQAEIDRRVQATNTERIDLLYRLSTDLQNLIISASLPSDLENEILLAYQFLEKNQGKGVRVSMRSSALGEDSSGTTFAGQFRSTLNVSAESIIYSYKDIVASKYSLPAITYRLNRGIPDEDVAMCVGCMAMVNAAAGGVMYSCNPLNVRDRSILINSVWGLPKAVVDGSIDPDLFIVSRNETFQIHQKSLRDKKLEFVCFPEEGVCRQELTGEKSKTQSISDGQALDLAKMADTLEDFYGSPQDIEWAIDSNGSIFILQCRPLQEIELRNIDENILNAELENQSLTVAAGGQTASPGVAFGPVYIVKNDVDKLKFPAGSVLVTAQALPRWAPMLGSASAVITEIGGITGHLANVSREFGIPAIFGLAGATEIFQNAQEITVDADGHRVYTGKIDSLLNSNATKKNLMAGSPIFEILEKVSQQIVPLNLLDPDNPDFHPRKCTTLHDITRFCHEKSVHEMFNFGKEHRFSERSSKQLVCDVPMQWWIINLDDGFKENIDGKFVHIDNIVSIPMLAMWEGIIAVPWEGPPPVDAKGFMSVLMQATTNPALDPSMRSAYSARNYFMLSRNFCSLSSRFGFHFSTIEALVSERSSENYVRFTFKGGAADFPRRRRRAIFVGEILERFEFRSEIREDSAFARVEGLDQAVMEDKLRILGYLIIHTRQLDMVMSNGASINQYRNKILADLNTKVLKIA
ncbi:MAG: PEP/pyruvate-binding domain-containing protein [Desulfomonilaceae bacterium]|jgi:pyruvate,water dikinase